MPMPMPLTMTTTMSLTMHMTFRHLLRLDHQRTRGLERRVVDLLLTLPAEEQAAVAELIDGSVMKHQVGA